MIYLDPSVLASYYLPEQKSAEVQKLLTETIDIIAISSLTELEFSSALSRRVRVKELTQDDSKRILALFSNHIEQRYYTFLPVTQREFQQAVIWIQTYETSLRTLDSLQMAVAFCSQSILWTSDAGLTDSARKLGVAHRRI